MRHGSATTASIHAYYTWFKVGDAGTVAARRRFRLDADALTAMMLVMVTFIGTLIAIYSVGYMHGDPGYPRFFAEVSLFVFSMTTLVLADNFAPALRRLGRRRPVQLSADRLLVRQAGGGRRGPQGVPRHAHRRRRPVPRHPAVVVAVRPSRWIIDDVFAASRRTHGRHSTTAC